MKVVIIQPPIVQLNTPYPSGAYLQDFFKKLKSFGETDNQITTFTDSPTLSQNAFQIAQKAGFASASYFTEVFTRSEKIPPSEYRKYHQ